MAIDITASVETTNTSDHALDITTSDTYNLGATLYLRATGTTANGIFAHLAGNTLNIGGTVSATGNGGHGISFTNPTGLNTINILTGATVAGETNAIDAKGSLTISNGGNIRGGTANYAIYVYGIDLAALTLTNTGSIAGSIYAKGTSHVTNSSTISGSITTAAGASTIINSGTIGGSITNAQINSSNGALSIENTGTITGSLSNQYGVSTITNGTGARISGTVTATGGASTVTNSGTIASSLTFGAFDDTYNGQSGIINGSITLGGGNDKAYGGANAETIEGGDGDDTLDGAGGSDRLNGGAGTNRIDGGAGNDTITKSLAGTVDTIIGGAGIDTLIFSGTTGATLDLAVTSAQETGYGTATVSGIENVTGTAQADVLAGDTANNTLSGNGGADQLRGEGGNDTLNGGGDVDGLWGGIGDDRLDGGDGSDSVWGEDGKDNLYGGAGADSLWGGAGNDALDGGAGSDMLAGEVGDDTLYGFGDADVLWGADGNDGIDCGSGADLAYGDMGNDTILGGADADTLMGGAGNDGMDGGSGNDILRGEFGNDTIFGGLGDDILYGGAGKDYLSGGSGKNVFAFTSRPHSKKNVDTIAEFIVKDNTVWLDNKFFKAFGRKGSEAKPANLKKSMFSKGLGLDSADDHLIYHRKTGVLYYDDDGNGPHKEVVVALFAKKENLTHRDFMII